MLYIYIYIFYIYIYMYFSIIHMGIIFKSHERKIPIPKIDDI